MSLIPHLLQLDEKLEMMMKLMDSLHQDMELVKKSLTSESKRHAMLEDTSHELSVRFDGQAARFSALSSRVKKVSWINIFPSKQEQPFQFIFRLYQDGRCRPGSCVRRP